MTYAVAKGNIVFVRALLAHRADANVKEEDGGRSLRQRELGIILFSLRDSASGVEHCPLRFS